MAQFILSRPNINSCLFEDALGELLHELLHI